MGSDNEHSNVLLSLASWVTLHPSSSDLILSVALSDSENERSDI